MRVKTRIIAGTIAASAAAGAVALSGGTAMASTPACTTSNSHAHSVTAKGTVSDTWTTKIKCSRDYKKWEHRVTHSYTGGMSDMHLYRNEMAYPHWTQQETLRSISAKGTVSYRVTDTSG